MNCTVNQDQRLLHNILESIIEFLKLDKIMGWDKSENSIAHKFEENKGLDAIEEVQRHPNIAIYKLSNEILITYFDVVDDDHPVIP